MAHVSIVPTVGPAEPDEIDPFDTSAVTHQIVQPKATEIRFLEKELLSDTPAALLKQSLSDPDFDPRAEEPTFEAAPIKADYDATARRKSSLSLNIVSGNSTPNQKSVGFLSASLLGAAAASGGNSKHQKPLTPYYAGQQLLEDQEPEDPFDTSFVPHTNPSQIELSLIERDLLQDTASTLRHSLSDPDFDPRAVTPHQQVVDKSDLLAVDDQHDIKVLTPAQNESRSIASSSSVVVVDSYIDPFDTSSIEKDILPGRAELRLIEDEFLVRKVEPRTSVLDSCSDSQELGLGDKVLTPQIPFTAAESIEEQDPFDTSIANNLAPGRAEIKQLESELIN